LAQVEIYASIWHHSLVALDAGHLRVLLSVEPLTGAKYGLWSISKLRKPSGMPRSGSIKFNKLITFHGDNNDHHVSYDGGGFECDCEFFLTHRRCGHTMAIEILLKDMLPVQVPA
jgi:hypothetical protein